MTTKKEIEKYFIEQGIKIAKAGHGAIMIIREGELKYKDLFPDRITFDIFKEPRRFYNWTIEDGAIIVGLDGMVISPYAHIENVKTIQGYGARHCASHEASINNTVVMVSEQDKKIRIWKKGKIIQEIDPYAKDIEKKTEEIVNFLESRDIVEGIGAGTIGVAIYNSALPLLQIPLPAFQIMQGVLIFGSVGVLIRLMIKHFKGKK